MNGPAGSQRLLAGWHQHGRPSDLPDHLDQYGPLPAPGRRMGLIDSAAAVGLAGRGGGWFPTAIKMRAVTAGRAEAIVVANGAESDPASDKDRVLLSIAPHLVFDGAVLAAQAIGASDVIVCLSPDGQLAATVHRALAERARAGMDAVPIQIRTVGGGYVGSEETALIQQLNGGPPLPTFVPPRPFQQGVGRRPTLVQNVETLAHLALLGRYGPDWFREVGDHHTPGTTLVTVGGAVATPGVYEIELGHPLHAVLAQAGGQTEPLQAVLVGGYLGNWLPISALDTPLTPAALRAVGAVLGPGMLLALPASSCGLAETARIVDWLASQNAGQCGPCTFGLPAVAADLTALARGQLSPGGMQRLRGRLETITGRGACHHPDGAIRLAASALRTFHQDVSAHGRRQPCPGTRRPPIAPLPRQANPGRSA